MTFYGKEATPKAAEEVKPLRTYSFINKDDQKVTLEAHYLQFQASHVSFWRLSGDDDVQDTLVTAIQNTAIHSLKEITE